MALQVHHSPTLFKCIGIVRDRSDPLQEFPRGEEGRVPLTVAGAITLVVHSFPLYILLCSPP
jgi:hypothetical protein